MDAHPVYRHRSLLLLLLAASVSACSMLPAGRGDAAAVAPGRTGEAPLAYRCTSGTTIQASYPTDSIAFVQYGRRNIAMSIAVSASGARYVGEMLEWWTRGSGPGSEGTLLRHLPDGTSGDVLERCVQAS